MPQQPPSGGSRLAALLFASISGVAATIALILSLVSSVIIGPTLPRLIVTLGLGIIGVAALILFSDGIERSWPWSWHGLATELLNWLAAAVVALAIAVLLGIPAASILGASPSWGWVALCDLVLGILAGAGALVVTLLSGWALRPLSHLVAWIPGAKAPHDRLVKPVKREGGWRHALGAVPARTAEMAATGWRHALRTVVAGIAGMAATTVCAEYFTHWPAARPAAADTSLPTAPGWNTIGFPLLLWFLGTGGIWLLFYLVKPVRPQAHPRHRRATHASALAVGLAIVVGLFSASFLESNVHSQLSSGPNLVSSAPAPLTATRAAYLAAAFEPYLRLERSELWDPTTVDWYWANSKVTKHGSLCSPKPHGEMDGCRTLKCGRVPGLTCEVCDSSTPKACAPRGDPQNDAVYYRYVDATNLKGDGPAHPARHTWGLLQYGLFYNYDSLGVDLVTQWHQADWEQVSVLLEEKQDRVWPVEVAFSEHCYGAVVPAARVIWSGTHPVSYVGRGSHANYPTQNNLPIRFACVAGQAPRYLGIAGVLSNPRFNGTALELPLAYLIGLHDSTGGGRQVIGSPVSAVATDHVWKFHGYWGKDNNVQVLSGRARTDPGPESPQDQGPWTAPFENMLCARGWLKISPVHARDTWWIC